MPTTPLDLPAALPGIAPKSNEITFEDDFKRLVKDWKQTRRATSSAKRMADHPAYQKIIDMGMPVVPLIIEEMTKEPDHWFIALHAITGASPVPPESRGIIDEMTKAWINWWRNTKGGN